MKILIRFFNWLHFNDEWQDGYMPCRYRIVRIKSWNCFLVDKMVGLDFQYTAARMTLIPIWDVGMFRHFLKIPKGNLPS